MANVLPGNRQGRDLLMMDATLKYHSNPAMAFISIDAILSIHHAPDQSLRDRVQYRFLGNGMKNVWFPEVRHFPFQSRV